MTVVFRSEESGTSARAWDRLVSDVVSLTWFAALDSTSILVVAPHPDDETLGAGGLIAGACAAGHDVVIVSCTDGEAAAVAHDNGADLGSTRRTELDHALSRLSDTSATRPRLLRLGLADGELSHERDRLTTMLRPLVDSTTLVVGPWAEDGHPDHEAVGSVCRRLADELGAPLLEYPIWMWHWGTPEAVPTEHLVRLPLPPSLVAAKLDGVEAYESQRRPPVGAPILSDEFIQHFGRDTEVFIASGTWLHEGSRDRSSASFFERMYASTPTRDPWEFATSPTEQDRFDDLVSLLSGRRYQSCCEPGCSTGELTRRLASISGSVLAMDLSPTAIGEARRRNPDLAGVTFRVASFPDAPGRDDGQFDLVVLSEIGYYFQPDDLRRAVLRIVDLLEPGGVLVASHWTGRSDDHVMTGARTHQVIAESMPWNRDEHHERPASIVDIWTRPR